MLTKVRTLSIFKESIVEDLYSGNYITRDSMTKEIFLWLLFCSYNTQVISCAATCCRLWLQWRKQRITAMRIKLTCYSFQCSFPRYLEGEYSWDKTSLASSILLFLPSPESFIWQQSTYIFIYAFSVPRLASLCHLNFFCGRGRINEWMFFCDTQLVWDSD